MSGVTDADIRDAARGALRAMAKRRTPAQADAALTVDAAKVHAILEDLDRDAREDVIAAVEAVGRVLEESGGGSGLASFALGYRAAELVASSGAILDGIDAAEQEEEQP